MELGGSFRWSNSNRSLLQSESVTSECARIAGYERLSKSMRLPGECDFSFSNGRKKNSKVGLGLLSKIFSFRRISSGHEKPQVAAAEEEKKKEKKRSSWLPEPGRRWPIQGWWLIFLRFDYVTANVNWEIKIGFICGSQTLSIALFFWYKRLVITDFWAPSN